MKVLMINVVCGIRSTGRICTDLATELETQGHEVKIAYGRENVPEQFQKYAIKIGSDLDVKLHGVKARLFDGMGWGSKFATKKFITWVKEYNPDVIHLHNIHGYYINVEVLFKYLKTCGKKVIWTLHDCWAFTGHSAYCDAIDCRRWEYGCDRCPQLKEYPKSFLDNSKNNWILKKKFMSDIPDLTIVTPSRWLAGLVGKSFLSNYPTVVIHNGIDTSQFKPLNNDFKKYHNIESKIMLLGVAITWNENKGLSDYLSLADKLGSNYQIVILGVSEKQKLELPGNVLGLTRTNSVKELAQIYSAADYLLNLSKTENYPNVILESMCCGTPVITYDVGGSKESVETAGGIVVKKGDIDAIVNAIKSSTAKINIVREEFDNSLTVHKYLDEYVESAQQSGRGYWKVKSKLNLLSKKVVLGVASIWESRKGLDDIIALSNVLSEEYQLIVIGVSEEQKRRLPSNIIGISRTNNIKELSEYYAVADVFVNPTYEDNYPTTNLEAIACGTPVISYNTGGSPESTKLFGISIEKGDFNMLKQCVTNNLEISEKKVNIDYSKTVLEYMDLYS